MTIDEKIFLPQEAEFVAGQLFVFWGETTEMTAEPSAAARTEPSKMLSFATFEYDPSGKA